eukprot:5739954-Alexandrium_andersonii.AAC.1
MSASLVGSEMCIRDRSMDCTRSAAGPRRPSRKQQAAALRWDRHRQAAPCLLYTSDAADDM